MGTLGIRLKNLRLKSNKKIVDLARAIGISIQAWTDYEKDRVSPKTDKLIAISQYFNVSTDYLIFGNENEFVVPQNDNVYSSYIECLIKLLSKNLISMKPIKSIKDNVEFYTENEVLKIFAIEYQQAINANKQILTSDEIEQLLLIISKRFNYLIKDK